MEDNGCAGITVSAISFGIEFLQVQSQKNVSLIKDTGLLMNEKELVLLATKGGKKKKKNKAAACSTFLVKADCEMENRGYRWLHLKRSFFFFKKLPDFI